MSMSRKAIEYLKSMADNYDLELAELKNNEVIIAILERQGALIESLIERNKGLAAQLGEFGMLKNSCDHSMTRNVWFPDISGERVYTTQCATCLSLLKSRVRK